MINLCIVIMGGGRSGLQLAKELITDKKNVTISEMDKKKYTYLSSKTDYLILYNSETDNNTHKNSEVSNAYTFVATTGNDDSNFLASLIARKLCAKKIITRVNKPQHKPVFISNNFINVIVPETLEVGYLEKLVLKPKIAELFIVDHGKAELFELHVNNPHTIGKTVGEMNLDNNYFSCGIYNNESTT